MKLKLLSFLVITLTTIQLIANDTSTYFIDLREAKSSENEASYLRKVFKNENKIWEVKDHYLTGELYKSGTYTTKKLTSENGLFMFYYKNGQLKETGEFVNGQREGKWLSYYDDGQLNSNVEHEKGYHYLNVIIYWENGIKKRNDEYKNGELVKGICYNEKGEEIEHFPYECMPEFPGGIEALFIYLRNNVKYNHKAKAKGIKGKVLVNFVIGQDGSIRDVKVIKSVHRLLDEEAIRVISLMPKWNPGRQRGKNVSVSYNIPINFILRKN